MASLKWTDRIKDVHDFFWVLEIALKFLTKCETSLPNGVGLALPSIEGRGHSKELLLETNPIYTFNFFAAWRSESVPLHYLL